METPSFQQFFCRSVEERIKYNIGRLTIKQAYESVAGQWIADYGFLPPSYEAFRKYRQELNKKIVPSL